MAKMNKYWGLVAVGALTAAAAGAAAAHFVKNNRRAVPKEDFDAFEDLDDFSRPEHSEEKTKEEKEAFQAWDTPSQEETPSEAPAASEENTEEDTEEITEE